MLIGEPAGSEMPTPEEFSTAGQGHSEMIRIMLAEGHVIMILPVDFRLGKGRTFKIILRL